MRYLSVILLIVLGIFSTGCETGGFDHALLWLEPIEFSQHTKDWILSHEPIPEYVKEDLNKIAILNDTIREIKNSN